MRYLRSFKLLLLILSIGALLAYVERQRTSEYGHLSERTHARGPGARAVERPRGPRRAPRRDGEDLRVHDAREHPLEVAHQRDLPPPRVAWVRRDF